MEDPLTEDPPPSRFFDEDLNNFTPRSPPLPHPTLTFPYPQILTPSLLIVAISPPSIHLINQISSKTLIGTLTLPELPTKSPSNIYSLNDDVIVITINAPLPAERSHPVAKLLLLGQIRPEKVLILDSVQSQNFRGRLPPDEDVVFKLETVEEKLCSDLMVDGHVEYFPSGSLIEGIGAAVLARCQMMKTRGSLCVSWPETGRGVALKVKSLLEGLLPNVKFDLSGNDLAFYRARNSRANSEMYT